MVLQDKDEKGQADGYAPLDSIGVVPLVHLPTTVVTDSVLSTHAAASDPHTGYQLESEKGAVNGYAELDSDGYVPVGQLPSEFWGWNSAAVDLVPDTQDVLWEVPSGMSAAVRYLMVKNATSVNKDVDIHVRESGAGSSYSIGSVTLGDGEYAIYTDAGVLPLSAGDTIEGVATDGTSISFIILVQTNG